MAWVDAIGAAARRSLLHTNQGCRAGVESSVRCCVVIVAVAGLRLAG